MSTKPARSAPPASDETRGSSILLVVLLVLGLGMRTLGAWIDEYAQTSDHGIICLMVKHMLEGRGFPAFYYGQAYLGAIEPAISAALCAVFGLTGFWINMGTALMAWGFLPLVYLWGRGAAGRAGGLAALAFCVIGPSQYFQFESWSYGGYAGIPFFSCLVLLLAVRLLAREAAGSPSGHAPFLALGAVAGLGWWQSPLLIAAFLTSAILFVAVLRRRVFTLRLLSGATGFLLGSLPLWVWNFRNHWLTFEMMKTHDSPSLLEGLKLFYLTRLPDLLEFFRHPPLIRIALGLLALLLAVLALARLVGALCARSREQALYLGAAVLFLIVFSILFGRSCFARVNASPCLLVLIPALGVWFGAATAWLAARTRWGLGWLPLAALIALQAAELPERFSERRDTAAFIPRVRALGQFLRQHGITGIYADYEAARANHALNFLLGEEFVFSSQARERYRPYAAALEMAEQPAVLNHSQGFDAFLAASGTTAATGGVEGLTVQYAVQPPRELGRLVSTSEWEAVIGPGAGAARSALTDADAATGWTLPDAPNRRAALEIRFKSERTVTGLRLCGEADDLPAAVAVDGWRESEQAWTPLLSETAATRYFWSGPRFYWGGDLFRLACRFEPVRTQRIRLRLKAPAGEGTCRLLELQAFEKAPEPTSLGDTAFVPGLVEAIRARNLKRLYADRWEANTLHQAFGDALALPLLKPVFGSETPGPAMTLDARSGILVREREAEPTRRALADRLIRFRETAIGSWILIDFPSADPLPPHAVTPGLRWAGFGCLKDKDMDWAAAAVRSVREAVARRSFEEAIPLAERALAFRPADRSLAEALALCYGVLGDRDKAKTWRARAATIEVPPVPADARFKGGIELLGVGFEPPCAAPGATVRMKLFWRAPASAEANGLIVFVHFNAGEKTVFQDDHPLLAGLLPADRSAAPAVLVEERVVTVPAGTPAGDLRIELGVYGPGGKARRLRVESEFRSRKDAVLVPAALTVSAK